MSFAAALEAATALATEYTKLGGKIGGMATAADHDPSWSDADEEALGLAYGRHAELAKQIGAAIAGIARDHGDDWQRFLVSTAERLDLVTKHVKKSYVVAEYERDQVRRWIAGTLAVSDQPEIFARALAALAEHHDVLRHVARKS